MWYPYGYQCYNRIMPAPFAIDTPAATLAHARKRAALTLRALAKRAGTSHATLAAYEQGRKSPNAETFLRILRACDFGLTLTLNRRIRSDHGLDRGEELLQVLELAEQFPARLDPDLNLPIFRRNP